jgi:BirA family biotin operon repressor/biotin-[acetyl-CoA-carboxylase] ligase
VGLGLNVNTASFPEDIRDKATSIFIETGIHLPRVRLIREYLKRYEEYYEIFKGIGFEPVMKRWRELTDIIGRRIIVEVIGKKYIGKVQDIDKHGLLILKDNKGRSHRISSGDFTFLEPPL